jgi:hypothetical protein
VDQQLITYSACIRQVLERSGMPWDVTSTSYRPQESLWLSQEKSSVQYPHSIPKLCYLKHVKIHRKFQKGKYLCNAFYIWNFRKQLFYHHWFPTFL